jgi:aminopeptidase
MSYTPPKAILEKYAKLLVDFALGGGTGIKPEDVVYLQSPISALPLYRALRRAITDSGGVIINGLGDDIDGYGKYFYQHASRQQLTAFPDKYYKGLVNQVDHRLAVIADYDVHELDDVDPNKILLGQKATKPLVDWLNEKENKGLYTWTLGLYGTLSMAKEAGLSEEEYWQQIIDACYLDKDDPIAQWKQISSEVTRVAGKLTELKIDEVSVEGKDVNLRVKIGEKRKWAGGEGRNIPSYEVFTSPDWRGTEGWIRFNQPLYYFGPKVEGIELTFSKGKVVRATANKNEKLLKAMLATDASASQIGEFSLTDRRLSRITKFTANTLFDENIGGRFGNTHIAVGQSFENTYDGDVSKLSKKQLGGLGFNDSSIHVDMISTTDRTVTATLANGSQKVIYKNGQFSI